MPLIQMETCKVNLKQPFAYQETEDQLRSIQEIKKDMEKERPMDRLLCGDVGYGKTEVAIRAAFKAIADGKQVAIISTNNDSSAAALSNDAGTISRLSR